MDNIKEAGKSILEKQDSRTRTNSPIQHQLVEIQRLWDEVKKRLDGREGQIDDVSRESEKFHEILADNSDWLIEFGNKISTLTPISGNPDVVRQQMEETKVFNCYLFIYLLFIFILLLLIVLFVVSNSQRLLTGTPKQIN